MNFIINIFASSIQKYRWFFGPILLILALIKTNLLPLGFNEFFIPVIGILAIVFGLPFSSALRIDQLSFNLGPEYSREFVLFIAICVTYLNLTFWLFLKRLLFSVGNETKKDKSQANQKKRIPQSEAQQKKLKLTSKKKRDL